MTQHDETANDIPVDRDDLEGTQDDIQMAQVDLARYPGKDD